MPRTSTSLLLLVILLLIAGWSECRAQETGMLLGLRYETPIAQTLPYHAGGADSLSRAAYTTLLLTEHEGVFVTWPEADALLIPRPDGFWRVGTKRSVYNNWVEDFVWATPDGEPRTLAGIQPYNGEYCKGHRKQTILYAGPQYLSLDQRSAGYCEGAAHPWFFNTLAVVPLDSTTHAGLDITDILGPAAYETVVESTKAFLDGNENDDERIPYIEEPDAANWGLIHNAGGWTALARLEAAEEARHNAFADLPLAFDLPTSLTGQPQPAFDRERLEAFAPDAVDCFAAPGQDWLVILHADHLTIHPLTPDTIGEAVTTLPVAHGARAVLVQWTTGTPLQGWIRHFERLAQSSDTPP